MSNNGNEVLDQVQREIATDGEMVGTIVWTDFDGVSVRRDHVRKALEAVGLSPSMIGEDITPRAAFGSAVRDFGGVEGYKLDRPVRRSPIVRILKATDDKVTPYRTCAVLSVDDTGIQADRYTAEFDDGAQDVLTKLTDLYDRHRYYADSAEVSTMITDAFLEWFGGCRLSRHGKVYWVPASSTAQLHALLQVCSGIEGCHPRPVPIHRSSQSMASVREGAAQDFTSRIRKLQDELHAFASSDSKTRAQTLERRLESFAELREQVDFYAEILDTKRDQLVSLLDTAKAEAQRLLTEVDG